MHHIHFHFVDSTNDNNVIYYNMLLALPYMHGIIAKNFTDSIPSLENKLSHKACVLQAMLLMYGIICLKVQLDNTNNSRVIEALLRRSHTDMLHIYIYIYSFMRVKYPSRYMARGASSLGCNCLSLASP